jgi:endo-1,4-beta-xylanase
MLHAAAPILCPAGVRESWVNPPGEPVPGVLHRTFMSASMEREVGYQIQLPPGYEGSERRIPVTPFLHGMTDCEATHPHPFPILDAAIRPGEVKPAILVHTTCGRTSWSADAPDGSVVGDSVFIKDLIPHVDATDRTIAAKGGHGAIKFAFKYPEFLSSAVAYGGGFRRGERRKDRGSRLLQTMFGGDSARFDAESPAGLLAAKGSALKGQVALRLVVGEKGFLPEDNRRFKGPLEVQGLKALRFSAAGFAN